MVAHDGAQAWVWDIPHGKPEWKDDHPIGAIDKFLASHSNFAVDEKRTRFGITSSPRGFLRKAS
jgi:cephalosporin hydroxylase